MIPDTVKFTELEVAPRQLLDYPRNGNNHAWPREWTRHQFTVAAFDDPIAKLDRWMAKNIQGRWGSYSISVQPGERIICVAFELLNEAIMFRLKEGETAWREDE